MSQRQGPPGRPGGGSEQHPQPAIQRVLDADGDGELSEIEIRHAPKALQQLDRDGDGKLSQEELGGPRPMRMEDRHQGGDGDHQMPMGMGNGMGMEGRRQGGGRLGIRGGVRSVSPAKATAGSSNVRLTLTLATNSRPPIPPAGIGASAVRIGPYVASSVFRTGSKVTATVDIPAGAKAGRHDVVVEFPGPPHGNDRTIRALATNAFTVLPSASSSETSGAAKDPLPDLPYAVVDTGQQSCYDNTRQIQQPATGKAFAGQDAQYRGWQPRYRDHGNGTVSDLNTGLMWQKNPGPKANYAEATKGARSCRTGDRKDWRLPTIKELYSLIDFNGSIETMTPYIDTGHFGFSYPDTSGGRARIIDAQYWSNTEYVGKVMHGVRGVFGVNFADGRIKGYPRDLGHGGRPMTQFVRYVRGNPKYGQNQFVDNGDGTITDRATGLMWQKGDSGEGMDWENALAYAESLEHAGHDDWRLPNAKELQSIVDYTRAPDARGARKRGPAIDPIFDLTTTESWFWTGTTHLDHGAGFAVYVTFGQAFGVFSDRRTDQRQLVNVHGAGAQRSDPKTGDPGRWADGFGPQRDQRRVLNYVRAVRDLSQK